MSSRTLYYFAVGGTGALSVEPLLHLCAAGLGPDQLAIILIDVDAGSPALARALDLMVSYEQVRSHFDNPTEGFFRTELVSATNQESVWTPLGSGTGAVSSELTLEGFVQKSTMTDRCEDAKYLLDLLFSDAEQKEKLKEGFRGHPAIGSVLMHGLKDAPIFKQLTGNAKNDTESSRFFATGSVFGGTGAAGLPVLSKILRQAGIASSRLAAALVTPYYSLGQPSEREQQDKRLKPDSARFLPATAAALPTYTQGETDYGRLYVVGDDRSLPHPRKTYSAGGTDQRNDPHVVEMFAALAAINFARLPASQEKFTISYVTVADLDPTWTDLTVSEINDLVGFLTASNFFLQYFGVQRSGADEQRLEDELKKMAWLQNIGLGPGFVRSQAAAVGALSKYFEALWGYLWAVTHNTRSLRLVDFGTLSECTITLPSTYASGGDTSTATRVKLPRVDNFLFGHNVRRKNGWFRQGDVDRLSSLAEMFNWYNQVKTSDQHGVRGLLRYLREGSHKFNHDWYSQANT